MNTTSSAGASAKSVNATLRPVVSGSSKSGAGVPSGTIVDGVRAIAASVSPLGCTTTPAMTEPLEPELERGIHEDPDDDARYQVYADWLAGQGNPRGELAAVQLAREREDTPELAAREAALFEQHATQLRGIHSTRYTQWLEDLCSIRYKAGFWRWLTFGGSAAELGLVLAHPSARLLHTLHIRHIDDHEDEYDSAIAALASIDPRLGGLRELRIGDVPEGQGAGASYGDRACSNLGDLVPACPRLTTLRLLCPNFDLGGQTFTNLRWLDARMGASAESLTTIAQSRLPRLEQLDLGFETSPEDELMWASMSWPEDALDELLAGIDVAMPALRRIRLWPMPHGLDHPLIQRLADMPRIEVCDWDEGQDDASGTYQL